MAVISYCGGLRQAMAGEVVGGPEGFLMGHEGVGDKGGRSIRSGVGGAEGG